MLAWLLASVGLAGVGYDTIHRVFISEIEEFYAYTVTRPGTEAELEGLLPGRVLEKATCVEAANLTATCSYREAVSYREAEPTRAAVWTSIALGSAAAVAIGIYRVLRVQRFGSLLMWVGAALLLLWAALFRWGNPWGSYDLLVVSSAILVAAAASASLATTVGPPLANAEGLKAP